MEGKGLQPQSAKHHLIVAGWNHRTPTLIRNLTHPELAGKMDVVILADMQEEVPIERFGFDDHYVSFVRGEATNRGDLDRANLRWATGVVILADDKHGDPDGQSILKVLTIEKYCRELEQRGEWRGAGNIYTVAEMVSEGNRGHFLDAGADEVICADELSQMLFLQAIRNPGVSQFMQEILTVTERNDVHSFTVEPGSPLLGRTFDELLPLLRSYSLLLLAVNTAPHAKNSQYQWASDLEMVKSIRQQTGLAHTVFSNPLSEAERKYQLREGDVLIILAESDRTLKTALKKMTSL